MNQAEVEKYQRCYREPSYRMGKRRLQRMKKDMDSLADGVTVLDVGTGRGETVEYAQNRGLTAMGIEIVPELCTTDVICASITDIPFETANIVCCYDMLEHLPPESVEKGLDELFRVANDQLFLTVSGNPASMGADDLHLSVHDMLWWNERFVKRAPDASVTRSTYCTDKDWHWHIELRRP